MFARVSAQRLVLTALLLAFAAHGVAASEDATVLRKIYDAALTQSPAYDQLRQLSERFPGRLSGSAALEGALTWAEAEMQQMDLDRVWSQPVMVPHWERGPKESARIVGGRDLNILALGGSIATPPDGVLAEVVEVQSLAEVAQLGRERVAGRIVFYNRPMDPRAIDTGTAYSGAGDQRRAGPTEAAKYGAVGVLVRSLTLAQDDHPHTGVTAYVAGQPTVPSAALGIQSAEALSQALRQDARLRVELKIHARWHPDAASRNVIGEIRGREHPDQVILIGGHIDSWDITPGAHDDGSGVVQSLEVLRLLRAAGIQPRHTVRCVLFTNEENGLRGAAAYATHVRETGEKHLLAIETDSGGFAPRGFELGSTQGPIHERAARWRELFEPYGIHLFRRGSGGADVAPLMILGVPVGNLVPDSQRYFDYHHTTIDRIEAVNPRELQLGAASLAALVYLVDTHGW